MAEILINSKARRDYHIDETVEAGLVLRGTEVKSLRAGKGQLRDAFVRVEKDEAWMYNAHIEEYTQGNRENHVPKAPRKLLLHRREIERLRQATAAKGLTIVPLSCYWKNRKIKVLLGLGRGKGHADKREDIKKRETDRELRRMVMSRQKGRG